MSQAKGLEEGEVHRQRALFAALGVSSQECSDSAEGGDAPTSHGSTLGERQDLENPFPGRLPILVPSVL